MVSVFKEREDKKYRTRDKKYRTETDVAFKA